MADVDGSLKRLGVDVIDVLQFHGGWFGEKETKQVLDDGGLETYRRAARSREGSVFRVFGGWAFGRR